MPAAFSVKPRKDYGYVSIEAALALIFFVCAIWAVYSLADFCILQARMQYAISTTAKEMSQYSYFYYKTGAQKADAALEQQGELAMNTYEQFAQVIQGGKKQVNDLGTDKDEYLDSILSGERIDELKDLASEAKGAGTAAIDMINNPSAYIKSMAALAGSALSKELKISAGEKLAYSMTRRHFGRTSEDADKALERLGVKGGYNSLDFSATRVFTDDKGEKIQVVVYYRVNVANIVPYYDHEIAICQTAVTHGWLGGDAPGW